MLATWEVPSFFGSPAFLLCVQRRKAAKEEKLFVRKALPCSRALLKYGSLP
jgi:hypothetical protein